MTGNLEFLFLGTGTSVGVPVIGCDCPVCTLRRPAQQAHPRLRRGAHARRPPCWSIPAPTCANRRCARTSASVDAVLYTHGHLDHVAGFDDLRAFCWHREDPLPIHATAGLHGRRCSACSAGRSRPENNYRGYVRPDPVIIDGPFRCGDLPIEPAAGRARPGRNHRLPVRRRRRPRSRLHPRCQAPAARHRRPPRRRAHPDHRQPAPDAPPDPPVARRGPRRSPRNSAPAPPGSPTSATKTTTPQLESTLPDHIRPAHDGLRLDLRIRLMTALPTPAPRRPRCRRCSPPPRRAPATVAVLYNCRPRRVRPSSPATTPTTARSRSRTWSACRLPKAAEITREQFDRRDPRPAGPRVRPPRVVAARPRPAGPPNSRSATASACSSACAACRSRSSAPRTPPCRPRTPADKTPAQPTPQQMMQQANEAAVDSELCLLGVAGLPIAAPITNRYYRSERSLRGRRPALHDAGRPHRRRRRRNLPPDDRRRHRDRDNRPLGPRLRRYRATSSPRATTGCGRSPGLCDEKRHPDHRRPLQRHPADQLPDDRRRDLFRLVCRARQRPLPRRRLPLPPRRGRDAPALVQRLAPARPVAQLVRAAARPRRLRHHRQRLRAVPRHDPRPRHLPRPPARRPHAGRGRLHGHPGAVVAERRHRRPALPALPPPRRQRRETRSRPRIPRPAGRHHALGRRTRAARPATPQGRRRRCPARTMLEALGLHKLAARATPPPPASSSTRRAARSPTPPTASARTSTSSPSTAPPAASRRRSARLRDLKTRYARPARSRRGHRLAQHPRPAAATAGPARRNRRHRRTARQ